MDSLLNLLNNNIVFKNKIYKIVKLSRIYIYGLQYKTDQQLVLNNDILLHTLGNKHIYNSFLNELEQTTIKFNRTNFFNYTVLNDDCNIENIYCFNNRIVTDYKDSIFFRNSNYLEHLYKLHFLIRSITSYYMSIDNEYNNKMKTELTTQLIFTLKVYEIKYGISEEQILTALTEYSQNFLNEYEIDYYNEYKNKILADIILC